MSMDDFEQWEEEYECFNNKDFARLVDLRTRDFMKDKSDFGLKIRLCVYMEFTEDDLLESLMRDQRFILAGEIDGVFSKFKLRSMKP